MQAAFITQWVTKKGLNRNSGRGTCPEGVRENKKEVGWGMIEYITYMNKISKTKQELLKGEYREGRPVRSTCGYGKGII